jgi:hypothetical protein
MKYYEINEDLARRAKEMNSFSDYIPGSRTEEYRSAVDEVYKLAEECKADKDDKIKSKIDYLADLFAKKYADWINKESNIECMCPSVMISGSANFPVHKKEKQNSRRDTHWKEYNRIMSIKDDIRDSYRIRDEKQGTATAETFDNDFFNVVQNEEDNRLQLFFEDKPDENIRSILKSNGYHWSGKNGCWQRQLTDNARRSIKRIIKLMME